MPRTTRLYWPRQIWLVRHGQSAGNVALEAAQRAALPMIDIATRDMDTPLSELGVEQARALGRFFLDLPRREKPTVVLSSPYVRARTTAEIVVEHAKLPLATTDFVLDERLREKEFGILDRLTRFGIEAKYPELSEQRKHVGKFYFRPPGGESWCDVILRLRSVIDTITREYRDDRVLIVGHQVIVGCFRYLFEHLDEKRVLELEAIREIANCSVTSYLLDEQSGQLVRALENFVAPLEEAGAPVTAAPDVPAAPKS